MSHFDLGRNLIKRISPGFVKEGVWKYRSYRELFRFAVKQRTSKYQIGDQPWLEEEDLAVFLRMIEESRSYLEYGSGGSTVLAAKLHKPFVSVDTDQFFLQAVHKKIGQLAPNQHLIHADIGWTKLYGYPAFEKTSARRVKRWKSYAELPWRNIAEGVLPDLVMVDGRFRVAAALTSCVHLANLPQSRILVDDYAERAHYHALEKYAQLAGMAGRMAIFQPPSSCSPEMFEAIEEYSLDWR